MQQEASTIKEEQSIEVSPIKEEFVDPYEEKPTQLEVEIETNISNATSADDLEKNPLEDGDDYDDSQHDSVCDRDDEYIASPATSSFSSSADEDQLTKIALEKEKKPKVRRKKRLEKTSTQSKKDDEEAGVIRKKRKRLDPKLTEEMIQKHISMICNLCNVDCKTFIEVGKHFKDCHPKIKPYIMCCNKRFTRRHYIAQHALQHEDPNCFRYV